MRQSLLFSLLLVLLSGPLFSQTTAIDPERITIARDSFGVPHIFAPTDAEVMYGLAWATLEDETSLPEWFLAALKCKLGKLIGVEGAKVDYAVQLMRVRETVEANYETEITPEYKHVLEGYAAGANAFLKAHPERINLKSIYPVTPQDIVVGHMLSFSLIQGIQGTLTRIVDGKMHNPWEEADEGSMGAAEPENAFREAAIGSNAFAFNSNKTADGNTYLAINPHQPIGGLMSWYEAHLCSEEGLNIHGAMFHGGSPIYLGTNENLGWAHTSGDYDGKDVYALEMHPKKKNWYKFDGKWEKLEVRRAKLVVGLGKKKKFRIPVWRKIWWSKFGPTVRAENGTFAIRMGSLMKITPSQQWYYMCKAQNYTQFRRALDMQGHAHYNVIYADRNDTIYYLANGLIPKRNEGYNWGGVVKGNSSDALWTEFYPVEEMVQFLNPASGYVFNTNNSAFKATNKAGNLDPKDFDPKMGYKKEENNRSKRFYELIAQYDKVTWEEFWDMKFDTQYPEDFTNLRGFEVGDLFKFKAEDHPEIAEAIRHLQSWDRGTERENPDFALVSTIFYRVNSQGKKKHKMSQKEWEQHLLAAIAWSQKLLLDNFGTLDLTTGDVQFLVRDDKMVPVGGGPDVLRAVYTQPADSGRRKEFIGDSYMQMVRFTKEGPEIWSGMPYGASNQPESPHYDDQMEMYGEKELRKVSLDKDKILKSAKRVYHPR